MRNSEAGGNGESPRRGQVFLCSPLPPHAEGRQYIKHASNMLSVETLEVRCNAHALWPSTKSQDKSSRPAWAAQWDPISNKNQQVRSQTLRFRSWLSPTRCIPLARRQNPGSPLFLICDNQYTSLSLSDVLGRKRESTHHLVVERADFGAKIPEFRIQISASQMNKSLT